MNKMKKLTKPLTLFLAVLTIVSCFSITASAASKSASLKTSDKIAYSGVITGKQCKYSEVIVFCQPETSTSLLKIITVEFGLPMFLTIWQKVNLFQTTLLPNIIPVVVGN